jgi:hypothetical protein
MRKNRNGLSALSDIGPNIRASDTDPHKPLSHLRRGRNVRTIHGCHKRSKSGLENNSFPPYAKQFAPLSPPVKQNPEDNQQAFSYVGQSRAARDSSLPVPKLG